MGRKPYELSLCWVGGQGYTSAPTVSFSGGGGGSGAAATAYVAPRGTNLARPLGAVSLSAWERSEKRWRVNYQGISPNRSPIYWRNSEINWSQFSCQFELEVNAVAPAGGFNNVHGAVSFGFGFQDNDTPGWSGDGSGLSGAGVWLTRLYVAGGTGDHGKLWGFWHINDDDYASTLGDTVTNLHSTNAIRTLGKTLGDWNYVEIVDVVADIDTAPANSEITYEAADLPAYPLIPQGVTAAPQTVTTSHPYNQTPLFYAKKTSESASTSAII